MAAMNSMFESLSSFFGTQNDNNTQQTPRGGYASHDGSPYTGGTPGRVRSGATPTASPYAAHDNVDTEDETSEREDLLDQHVAYYLKHHPDVHSRHNLNRIRPGVYNFDGREISVEWHYADNPSEQGYLICIDGPLRQPFADYMENSETGIEYDDRRLSKSALSQIQKGKRLSFGDSNKVYSRLEAMKVAKEQALVREKAAEFQKDGMQVPQHELMSKYKKTLSQKLGERRQRAPEAEPVPCAIGCPPPSQAPAPAPVPVARLPTPPPHHTPAASPVPSPTHAESEKAARTHGAPKYCAKHDRTEKRKKTKPYNESCKQCASVIQTNYVEFTLCPTCSEKDHRCMCCGAAAVGPASSPKAQHAPSSPMNAQSSPQRAISKSSNGQVSPMNLFGMPELFSAPAPGKAVASAGAGFINAGLVPAWPGQPASQGNAFTSNNAYASQNQMASQNMYASQNAYASPQNAYNPMASQNMMVGRQF